MTEPELWGRVERLVDEMSVSDVRAHDLGPIAAHRWRELGREIPRRFLDEERAASLGPRVAVPVLERARAAFDGPLLLFKGPEVGARYPRHMRFFSDLDVLVDDAAAAQEQLLAAGFEEVEDPTGHFHGIHHLTPIGWPGIPLRLEIHSRPKWPRPLQPPQLGPVFEAAVPSRLPVQGLQAPAARHHALLLAAHSWAHTPLRSLRDLVDFALIEQEAGRSEVLGTASEWDLTRLTESMLAVTDWLLDGGRPPAPVRIWARHLLQLREATVLEGHVEKWLSPYSILPPRRALARSAGSFVDDLTPGQEQSLGEKARRIGRAVRNAFQSKSAHGWLPGEGPKRPPNPD